MAEEPDGTLITLMDEDGNEHEFEHLATLDHEGSTYVALVPAYTEPEEFVESDGELVVLRMTTDAETGDDMLESISDENEFRAVLDEFEEMLKDDYDILGDDEDALENADSEEDEDDD